MTEKEGSIPNYESAWQQTVELQIEDPVFKLDIQARLKSASSQNPLILFVPWGVRPNGKPGDSEWRGLETIASYQRMLTSNQIFTKVLLMPADVYAIEINGYDWGKVTNYFTWVWNQAEGMGFDVIPWSILRQQNQEQYDRILRWETNVESLWRKIPKALWYRDLLGAAYRRSKATSEQKIKESAYRYLQERIAEARIIESVYKPIKISMVSPEKDNYVDCQLPRLYILPRNSRFPWLK